MTFCKNGHLRTPENVTKTRKCKQCQHDYNQKYWSTIKCPREYQLEAQRKVWKLLGGCCADCGLSDYRTFQIHHIAGNGSKERKELGRGWTAWKKIIGVSGAGYQLLCANCHAIKHHNDYNYKLPAST